MSTITELKAKIDALNNAENQLRAFQAKVEKKFKIKKIRVEIKEGMIAIKKKVLATEFCVAQTIHQTQEHIDKKKLKKLISRAQYLLVSKKVPVVRLELFDRDSINVKINNKASKKK